MQKIDYDILTIAPAPQGWYANIVDENGTKQIPIICWGLILQKNSNGNKRTVEGFVYHEAKQFVPAILIDGFQKYVNDQEQHIIDCYALFPPDISNSEPGWGSEDGTPVPEIDPEKFHASYELFASKMDSPHSGNNFEELELDLLAVDATDTILSESEIEAFNYRIRLIELLEIGIADKPIWNAIASYPLRYGEFPTLEEFMVYVAVMTAKGD